MTGGVRESTNSEASRKSKDYFTRMNRIFRK
jgi:hypothetical protein